MPGRVKQICDDLLADDWSSFYCHKSVHSAKGGTWVEDDDGDTAYKHSGNESVCTGSMVYLLKANAPSVAMRLAAMQGDVDFAKLMQQADTVIDPPKDD